MARCCAAFRLRREASRGLERARAGRPRVAPSRVPGAASLLRLLRPIARRGVFLAASAEHFWPVLFQGRWRSTLVTLVETPLQNLAQRWATFSLLRLEWPRRQRGTHRAGIRAHARGAKLLCDKSQPASWPSRPCAMRWPWCPRRLQLGDSHERLAGTAPEEFSNLRKASRRSPPGGSLN